MSSTGPSGPYVSAIKGLSLASTFTVLGSLYTLSSATIPGIVSTLSQDSTSAAQSAAQQFAIAQRATKTSTFPTEFIAIFGLGFLSYNSYTTPLAIVNGGAFAKWKLYLLASLAMFSVIPLHITLLTPIEDKLLALADAPPHKPSAEPALEHSSTSAFNLQVPSGERPAITPIEEFEPYEDSPFSTDEYEREKVRRMLVSWSGRNAVRRVGVALSGILGMWAALG
nr:hypothetical protein B0A51_08496 [Rachicladosporium sp. CCFEE 5018]OQO28376.1 hypothetical protein B0A51_04868 [Rachicladosporium sp. CCFEE 5018]OQO28561.1 hypothetical protein B0A51_05607 [Rachicladosporium sp. CCFEE 5018]